MKRMIYFLTKSIVVPLMELFFLSSVRGGKNVPSVGPYILAPNHSSFIDHLLMGAVMLRLRHKSVYFLTRKESFTNVFSRIWHEAAYCIPINREKPELSSLKRMLEVLKRGEALVIYPEGTRSLTGQIQKAKPGIIKLALRCGVPIVPVGINGAWDILPKGTWVPRARKASIVFGNPWVPSRDLEMTKEKIEQFAQALMDEIASLAGQERDAPVLSTMNAGEVG